MHRSQRPAGLMMLNALLLAVLALVAFGPSSADARQAAGTRGQYTMLPSQVQGGKEHALYVIDATSMQLIALRYDIGRRELVPIGHRDLAADAAAGPRSTR